jgi:hypothetical protein
MRIFQRSCQIFYPPKQLTIIDSTETQQQAFRHLVLQSESVDRDDFDTALSRRLRNSVGNYSISQPSYSIHACFGFRYREDLPIFSVRNKTGTAHELFFFK